MTKLDKLINGVGFIQEWLIENNITHNGIKLTIGFPSSRTAYFAYQSLKADARPSAGVDIGPTGLIKIIGTEIEMETR